MIRIAQFRYRQALDLIGRARDAGDVDVIRACALVLRHYIIGRPVPRATIELIEAFSEE